jgi:hypothetical protein
VAATDPFVIVQREALKPVQRPLHGRPVEVEPGRDLGQRRLRRLATSGRHGAHRPRLDGQPSIRVEDVDRGQLAPGCGN